MIRMAEITTKTDLGTIHANLLLRHMLTDTFYNHRITETESMEQKKRKKKEKVRGVNKNRLSNSLHLTGIMKNFRSP